MSLLTPDEREQLVPPYPEYDPEPGNDPPERPTSTEIIARMAADAGEAAALGKQGRLAAVALVICTGNYEWVSFQRDDVMDACNALLDRYDEEGSEKETRRWG